MHYFRILIWNLAWTRRLHTYIHSLLKAYFSTEERLNFGKWSQFLATAADVLWALSIETHLASLQMFLWTRMMGNLAHVVITWWFCACICSSPLRLFSLLVCHPYTRHPRTAPMSLIAVSRTQLNICKNRNQGGILSSYNVYGSTSSGDNVYRAVPTAVLRAVESLWSNHGSCLATDMKQKGTLTISWFVILSSGQLYWQNKRQRYTCRHSDWREEL